jgi:hypothetical protein
MLAKAVGNKVSQSPWWKEGPLRNISHQEEVQAVSALVQSPLLVGSQASMGTCGIPGQGKGFQRDSVAKKD